MKNFLFTFLGCLLFSMLSFAQRYPIETERFDEQIGKGLYGPGTVFDLDGVNWSVNAGTGDFTTATSWAKVIQQGGGSDISEYTFDAWNTNGEIAWQSSVYDISIYDEIGFLLNVSEQGELDSEDYISVFYKLDGGEEIPVNQGYISGDFQDAEIRQDDFNGQTLQVIVRINNNDIDEHIRIDQFIIYINDSRPTLSFVEENSEVEEDISTNHKIRIRRNFSLSGIGIHTHQVSVFDTATGTADPTSDYSFTPTVVSFSNRGVTFREVEIEILDNNVADGAKTIVLQFEILNSAVEPGKKGIFEHTITINDDESQEVVAIELIDFQATINNNKKVALHWISVSDRAENQHFVVEHSRNGTDFNALKNVNTLVRANRTVEHTFIHQAPRTGHNYYRLQIINEDGTISFSPIREVFIDRINDEVILYPSMANHQVTLQFEQLLPKNTRVLVSNMVGQIVKEYVIAAGVDQYTMPITDLGVGSYFVQIGKDNQWLSLQFNKY